MDREFPVGASFGVETEGRASFLKGQLVMGAFVYIRPFLGPN